MTIERTETAKHIFIIGAKSMGQYGGYETFVDKLTEQHAGDKSIQYHISCKANGDGAMDETKLDGVSDVVKSEDGRVTEFTYHNAHVFKICCPEIGSAVAVYYDWAAVRYSLNYCEQNKIEHPVFYILTCRIGPFIDVLVKKIKKAGGTYLLNPDGHEFLRTKWRPIVRKYWKWSEKKMVNASDLVVCDSANIEKYIKQEYGHPKTTFIAYGADLMPSKLEDHAPEFTQWLQKNGLKAGDYYLIVGRFVPENNYETMLREFMQSHSKHDLAIVTNTNDKLKKQLECKLHFAEDPRIKFVGTVYDKELLKKIRENAYGYFHGHEVGGTNPSLLEALGSTELNLLLDVGFNREVGQASALYWRKDEGNLSALIDRTDQMAPQDRAAYGAAAKARIGTAYSWKFIGDEYRNLWETL